jgi:hypothetical protein
LPRWLLAAGEDLMLTVFHRLARSLSDAFDIVDEPATRRVKLNLGGSDPAYRPRSADCLGPRATGSTTTMRHRCRCRVAFTNVIGVIVIIQLATRILTWM